VDFLEDGLPDTKNMAGMRLKIAIAHILLQFSAFGDFSAIESVTLHFLGSSTAPPTL
jgi:hypothetical protein